MNQLSEVDLRLAALASAISDVLANFLVKQEATLKVLALKGMVSESELVEAMQSIPVEMAQKASQEVGEVLRGRMLAHLQQLLGTGQTVQ